MKREEKEVEGGRCIRDIDGRLGVNDIDRKRIWKQHVKKIMNEENDRDHSTNADVLLGTIQRVTHMKIINAVKTMN